MSRLFLLHFLTPAKHASPFDINMAYDAGWQAVIPYGEVQLEEVTGLVQDAIFSRGPKGARATGLFIGGRDVALALDMLERARGAMVPPFEVSVCVDPSGGFTTAAAMLAAVERQLRNVHHAALAGMRVLIVGGTGPVGSVVAVLAARAGAEVTLVGRRGAEAVAAALRERFNVALDGVTADSDQRRTELLQSADVVLATAKAGVQVLSAAQLAGAPRLKVAADVNAVPPLGLEGVDVMDDGAPIRGSASGAVGIGALAIGNVKYRVQQTLLTQMREADKAVFLSFEQAFDVARAHAS
ncbi:MAG TPA: NAD(P)-dependent methylenetetrahydromethanopterin dehydrogenase [Burkholderiales bacterium]